MSGSIGSLRLLYVAHGFPPNQAAGAEWRAYRTARAARLRGHEVMVLAADDLTERQQDLRVAVADVEGISVQRLSYGVPDDWGSPREFHVPEVDEHLHDLLTEQAVDLVHVISGARTGAGVIDAAARVGVPVVVTLTDFWFLCPRINLRLPTGERCSVPEDALECVHCLACERRRYRIPQQRTAGLSGRLLVAAWQHALLRPRAIERLSRYLEQRRGFLAQQLGQVDVLIAPSRFLQDIFVARGVPAHRLRHMRQGLDTSRWEPVPAAAGDVDSTARLRVGYIGQLADHKGVLDVVAALRSLDDLPDIHLRIYGDPESAWPPFVRRLREAIGSDARIELAGGFDNRRIRTVHAGLDVLVVPSRWYENSPNVILEAFACGTPVIAADLGGMAELVEHEVSGLLYPVGAIAELANRLRRLVDEQDLLPRLARGIPAVKTLDQEIDELESLYMDLIESRSSDDRAVD